VKDTRRGRVQSGLTALPSGRALVFRSLDSRAPLLAVRSADPADVRQAWRLNWR